MNQYITNAIRPTRTESNGCSEKRKFLAKGERKKALNKGKTVTDGEEREGILSRPGGKRAQTGLGQWRGAQLARNMEQLGEQREIVRL